MKKKEMPHPMLHGQHDGKMPIIHKAKKEKVASKMKSTGEKRKKSAKR